VLNGLDLVVRPGETLGVVGESGAGKTTLAALLLRLADPTDGCISVDGGDLARVDARAWRRQVAWAPQHPTLFRGTIADNVRLGRPQAHDEDVRRAARLAGADAFVSAFPDGYETVVGDGGRPLSAGERRRLALARAFLKEAPLLILDEPTADLDEESAALVGDAIEYLRGSRTILVVSHRPALLPHTDRVVRIAHGRAVELAPSEAVA
jgi:ABC-type multidrug transport system fused ATPase/permease subunit